MDGTVRDVLLDIENGEEGLLQFMQFASPGSGSAGKQDHIST